MIATADRLFSLQISAVPLAVERALYGVILLLGGLLRLTGLGARPLLPLEATNAWAAWLTVHPPAVASAANIYSGDLVPSSALLYSLHSLLFWTLDGGDALARWLPALAGTGLLLLPWALRRQLGRPTALALAALLAVDPWLVTVSRVADGAMLSVALALVAVAAVLNLPGAQGRRWSMIAAAAVGLLLVSGVQAWPLVVVVGLAFVVLGRGAGETGSRGAGEQESKGAGEPGKSTELLISPAPLRPSSLALIAVAAALLGATAWLARLDGLGYVSASFGLWLGKLTGGEYGLRWLALRLWADQLLLLLFALLGLIGLWRGELSFRAGPRLHTADEDRAARNLSSRTGEFGEGEAVIESEPSVARPALSLAEGWPRFVTLWLAWAVILLLLPGRDPFALAGLSLPLIVLAAHALGWLIEQRRRVPLLTGSSAALVALLAALWTARGIFATLFVNSAALDWPLLGLLTTLGVLLIVVVAIAALNTSRRGTLAVAGILLAVLLNINALSQAVRLNFDAEVDSPLTQPTGFFAQTTHADVRQLVADVQRLSALRTGFESLLPVQVQRTARPDPLLGWYLRDMRSLTWTPAPTVQPALADAVDPVAPLVVTRSVEGDAPPRLPADYAGSAYGHTLRWLPDDLLANALARQPDELGVEPDAVPVTFAEQAAVRWSAAWRPLLRWLRYGEAQQPPAVETVVLWAAVE